MGNTVERYRKFCKIIGLHSVFNTENKIEDGEEKTFYNTSSLFKHKVDEIFNSEDNALPITKDTILFITADSEDKNKKIVILSDELDGEGNKIKTIETTRVLSEFDTMLWANGSIYSLSQKNVKSISYNTDTDKLDIIYSDDFKQSIDVTELQLSRKIAVKFPLYKSEEPDVDDSGNEETYDFIRLFGQEINDSGRNFVIGMYKDEENIPDENKNNCGGYEYTTLIGKGNIASINRQIILGDFNEEDGDSKFIVCDGTSDSKRKNLFTISNLGDVQAMRDFVLSKETNIITHKLSDIHSVTDADWYKET